MAVVLSAIWCAELFLAGLPIIWIVVLATLDVGWAILNASALSFLGLGTQPPTAEWGAMLNEGRGYLRNAPWVTVAPGLAIALAVLAVNLVGDYLRDALDPRRR